MQKIRTLGATLGIVLGLTVSSAQAQQATLGTPQAMPQQVTTQANATKLVVAAFHVERDCACAWVEVDYQASDSSTLQRQRYNIPADPASPGTELTAFLTAIGAAHAVDGAHPAETGSAGRRINYRILTYLADAGRLPGVTLVP